jgi:elongation factor G
MSADHLQLLVLSLKDRYGLDVNFGKPPVQYRETLIKTVSNIEGKHKKQSSGSGQFGVCYIDMEPLDEGMGIEFESKVKGGAIAKTVINSIEKGVREQLRSGGPLGGFPVMDVRVTVVDGKMHSVDSKDIAFQSARCLAV